MRDILLLNADYEPVKAANGEHILKKFLHDNGVRAIRVKQVWKNEYPDDEDLSGCSGVILTGSNASAYERNGWISELEDTIRRIDIMRIPMLAICFGSQIVAKSLGGIVEPSGTEEAGYVRIKLTSQGLESPLFEGLPEEMTVCSWHNDVIKLLPKDAQILAYNEFCVQAYSVRDIYCTQFHPEFTPRVAASVARAERRKLRFYVPPDWQLQEKVINNFLKIAFGREKYSSAASF